MCGSFKPLYLQARRKGIATLSPSPMHRSFRVDGCGKGRTGRNKGSFSEQPNTRCTERQQTHVIIHIGNTPSRECGAHRRTKGGHAQISASKAGILCIHRPHTMQIPVPSLPKNRIRGLHGIPETTTLLSRVLDHGGLQSTTQ